MFMVCSEVLAVALTAFAMTNSRPHGREFINFVLLIVLAVSYAEAADRIERFKRFLGSDRVWTNHTSVWAFAAVITLPAGYASLLVGAVYAHTFALSRRHQSARPHRLLFTAATMMLATLAASTVIETLSSAMPPTGQLREAVAIVTAAVVFPLVNLISLLAGMAIAIRPPQLRALVPSREDVGFELTTIVLGFVTGELILHTIWLTPFVVLLLASLHRSSLVKQLQIAAVIDSKTGLLNLAAWREQAGKILSFAARSNVPLAIVLIDLDRFKRINDTHGHLAGDDVLAQVATTLRREIRDHDPVGRFGGEEFVVCLQGASLAAAEATAERLRYAIESIPPEDGMGVTASLGVAHITPSADASLDDLLRAADTVLYRAKSDGRNQVHLTQLTAISD